MDGSCSVVFQASCGCRPLFDEISDKWSMMILKILETGPHRFNELKRCIEGISQKSLTHSLRKMERNGLVAREVLDTSPVTVRYSLTELGESLLPPFRAMYRWTSESLPAVEAARAAYDARMGVKG